ncbi:T9SS type A sorting domain-containing protein [Tenacibaculum xiamenense]|uniref:T9SS type A sorting domain-containing protein n=1 Tax=Tenacibaculum xiamenense TaxID=1261553 RepID=UPI0038945CF1
MKKKSLPLLNFLLLFSVALCAQNYEWRNISLEESNYFDVVSKNRNRLQELRSQNTIESKKQIKQFERWADFWGDRISPNGNFVAPMHTYNEWAKEDNKNSQQRSSRNPNSNSWSLLGPTTPPQSNIEFYPGMGRVNTLAFQADNTNIMYVGTPAGGIWKTTDGGSTWTSKSDNLPNIGVSHIVISPTDNNVLYAATGDWDGGHNLSIGVVKSTDAGETWNLTGLTFNLTNFDAISKLLIDPNNTNTIFATTRNSIKRSTNGGTTWTDVHTDSNVYFNDIEYKTNSNSIIYATSKNGKFYISTNNGVNWQEASNPTSNRLDIAQTPNDPDLLISIDGEGIIRKSSNQGTSWTILTTISGYSSQGGFDIALAVSPVNKDLMVAGGIHGYRSTNGGTTWHRYLDGYWTTGNPYFYVHSDHHDMMFLPNSNQVFSVNDGGVFKGDASTDVAWTDLSSGLAITQYYNVSGTPQNAGKLILGAQDNDIAIYDGSNGFKGENPGSDGVEGLWNYSDSNIAWSASQAGTLRRTLDGFQTAAQWINTPSGAPFVWELEIHPTDPNTIYGGFGDIYKSTDRGDNWTNLNSGIGSVEFISIAPSDPNVIYGAGRNRTVKKTTNGGTSWTVIDLPIFGSVKSIEVHPTNPSEVYIAYSGYLNGRVYKSINGGDTWTNISGSLPNVPSHKIIYKTGTTDGELFLATDIGVYYWKNSANDWVRLGSGLPYVIVHDIEIHYASNKLRAATYGRGVWETSIDEASLGTNDEKLADDTITMFPNPTNNKQFTVKLNKLNGDSNILVYNIIGTVVKNITTKNNEEFIDLSNYSSGVYLVKVNNEQGEITKKLIVK